VSIQASVVTGVDFVSVPTRDLAAARAFYGEVLGLPCSSVWGRDDPVGAEYETGTVTIALLACDRLGIPFHPAGHPLALRVDDVATARAELTARGVDFGQETIDSGVCHMAHFRDPDGNVLMLHHRYAPLPGRE
jgi:catechol 2,3-dioxygenase-like lactoylglutathione lyase family enzyme